VGKWLVIVCLMLCIVGHALYHADADEGEHLHIWRDMGQLVFNSPIGKYMYIEHGYDVLGVDTCVDCGIMVVRRADLDILWNERGLDL